MGINWAESSDKFCKCHENWINVAFHLVCTPLMLLGWLSVCDAVLYRGISYLIAGAYILTIAAILPSRELLKSALTMCIIVAVCRYLELGVAGAFLPGFNE